MLEHYFVLPDTIDRIRGCWIGQPIEKYVAWLAEQGYSARSIYRRVPILMRFGEFAHSRGISAFEDLQGHVEAFVAAELTRRGEHKTEQLRKSLAKAIRSTDAAVT